MRLKLRELQGKTKNSSLTSNIPTKIRNWDKYKDQSKLSLIENAHVMTYVETAKLHPKPIDEQPLGMMVSGVSYSEKAEAGQAIINACKSMNSPDAIPLGEYRGFQMELYFDTVQRNYVVKLKGETSRDVPLGDDSHGNIVRIDNGIERFEEALADTKNSLENTEKQFETAKQEIEKPFAKEEELRAKTARLDELNILLNMDKKENEIVGGEPDEGEAVGGRKEKSYER